MICDTCAKVAWFERAVSLSQLPSGSFSNTLVANPNVTAPRWNSLFTEVVSQPCDWWI